MSLVYNTVFDDNFASWDKVNNTPVAKAGYGCGGGNAFTCSDVVSLYKLVATYASPLTALTVRAQYALVSNHTPTTIDGFNTSEKIMELNHSIVLDATYCGNMFGSHVSVNADGSISLTVNTDTFVPTTTTITSAAGLFPFDGTMHGIQVSFLFSTTYTLDYHLTVDTTDALIGSISTVNHTAMWATTACASPPPNTQLAGVNEVAIFASRGSGWVAGFANLQVDNVRGITHYGLCPANPLSLTACANPPPPPPPIVPPTPAQVGSVLVETTKRPRWGLLRFDAAVTPQEEGE